MANIDVFGIGTDCLTRIKAAPWFPHKTGTLRDQATRGSVLTSVNKTYVITFDSIVAPYIEYLELGTRPHDIPGAFGRPLPFGVGGRFNGKFHPGSTKHQGFISQKCVGTIIDYIKMRYKGVEIR